MQSVEAGAEDQGLKGLFQGLFLSCSSPCLPGAPSFLVNEWKGAKIKTFYKRINWLLKAGQVAPPLHSNSPLQLWGQLWALILF